MRDMAEAVGLPLASPDPGSTWRETERRISPESRAQPVTVVLDRIGGSRSELDFRRDQATLGRETERAGIPREVRAEPEVVLNAVGDLNLGRDAELGRETELEREMKVHPELGREAELGRETQLGRETVLGRETERRTEPGRETELDSETELERKTELERRALELELERETERELEREMEREFREESRALERELEMERDRATERAGRLERDLQDARARASRERSECVSRVTLAEAALRDVLEARDAERGLVRVLEQRNDDLERALRVALSSLESAERRLEASLEGSALLEAELEERDRLRVETQRLREEARDLRQELSVMQKQNLSRTPPTLRATVPRASHSGGGLGPHGGSPAAFTVSPLLQMNATRRERAQTLGPNWARSTLPLHSPSRFTRGHDPVTCTRWPTHSPSFTNACPPQRYHSQWEFRAALRLHITTLRGTMAPSRFLQLSRLWRS